MREKINSILLQCHSNTVNGIDISKAVSALEEYFENQLKQQADVITDACENQISEREEEINNLQDRVQEAYKDAESLEKDMELSNSLLIKVLPELELYKNIQSNHPIKSQELKSLIYQIEEQIIKNGQ